MEDLEHKLVRVITGDSDVRCAHCEKLLFKAVGTIGGIDIKCGRCGTHNVCLNAFKEQIVMTDANGTILYMNDELQHATGYSSFEALGQKPSLWGKQMPNDFYKQLWQTIKYEKRPISVQIRNKRKDGEFFMSRLTIAPVVGYNGRMRFFVGTAVEVPAEA
jgi:PAS domain S-box-containing protein